MIEERQVLLGQRVYKVNDLPYAGGIIRCAHCGGQEIGEQVVKTVTGKAYVYHRCTMYNRGDHPVSG